MTILTLSADAHIELRRDDHKQHNVGGELLLASIPSHQLEFEAEEGPVCDGDVVDGGCEQQPHRRRTCFSVDGDSDVDDDDEISHTSMDCKTVRFSIEPTVVHEYIHYSDMTEEERANAWITPNDKRRIRADTTYTRQLMSRGSFAGDNLEFCQRGLEGRRVKTILSSRFAVLNEQSRQRAKGFDNPMLIASMYSLACHKTNTISQRRGKDDFDQLTCMYLPAQLAKEKREGYGYYGNWARNDSSF